MTDRPVIFSGPMVRALLDGRKTMTRRLLHRGKARPDGYTPLSGWDLVRVDDRLWVRETWQDDFIPHEDGPEYGEGTHVGYLHRANNEGETCKWRSPIHMPRAASRLTLVVTATKIEHVQSITDADAIAEGARRFDDIPIERDRDRWSMETPTHTRDCLGSPRWAFGNYWNKLNGAGAWDENPWVVALTFVVHCKNIDQLGA